MFTNKTLLITGGTGSFGNAVAKRFLPTEIGEIRIFSRDEKKQNDMRRLFREKMPEHFKKLKFYIGDVRDRQALDLAMNGVDLIVFTGGIGENNSRLRRRVCENLTYLGVKFDYDANVIAGEDVMLTLPDSKVKIAAITTNEELMIARDTMNIVQNEE